MTWLPALLLLVLAGPVLGITAPTWFWHNDSTDEEAGVSLTAQDGSAISSSEGLIGDSYRMGSGASTPGDRGYFDTSLSCSINNTASVSLWAYYPDGWKYSANLYVEYAYMGLIREDRWTCGGRLLIVPKVGTSSHRILWDSGTNWYCDDDSTGWVAPSTNTWHHYVFALDGDASPVDAIVYMNGGEVCRFGTESSCNSNRDCTDLDPGHGNQPQYYAKGYYDEIGAFLVQISASDASGLYNSGDGKWWNGSAWKDPECGIGGASDYTVSGSETCDGTVSTTGTIFVPNTATLTIAATGHVTAGFIKVATGGKVQIITGGILRAN
jgi:hypothetical protein